MRGRGVLVGLVTLATALGVLAAPPDPVVQELADACEAARRFWEVPGLAVVVVRKGEVIHLQGYGSRRLGTNGTKDEPVSPDTLFPLASCTKAFTSAAIAALVDDEQMAWDDPVRRHLPTFRLSDETANKLVSVRDLLCHRSGVGGHDLLWYRAPWDLDESVRRIAEVPLSIPFRGGYQYSSVTVSAAGLAAANRSRGGWDELIRDKLLTPLGMTATAFTTKEAKVFSNRASGYQGGSGGVGVVPMPEYEMVEPNPAGSLFVTPRDYARWLNFQLNDGKAGGRQVVSAKQLSETKQPHTPIRLDGSLKGQHPGVTQMTYAMGWVVYDHRGERVTGHGGLIDGFRVLTVLLPERQAGFAIFANRHQTKLNLALGNTLADHLIGVSEKHRTNWNNEFRKIDQQETADKKAEREARAKARQPNQRPTRPDDQLAGVYFSPAYGEATLVLGKQPEWRVSKFCFPLEHWEGNVYRLTAGLFQDDLLEVVDDKNGLALLFRGMQFRRK